MKHYSHLTITDREEISRSLSQQLSIRTIATRLGRSPSTIAREIYRNSSKAGTYRAHAAQRYAKAFAVTPRRQRMLECNHWLWHEIQRLLHLRWSPDAIAVYLKRTYPDDMSKQISHETIYQAIYILPRGTLRQELIDCLRRSHRHRRKRRYLRQDRRGHIPNMISIHDRPQEVENRGIPGHWEGDLIIGKYHTSAVGTLVERTSRKVLICKLDGRESSDVVAAFEKRLKTVPSSLRVSLTYDRGKEMAKHEKLKENLDIDVYFCDPQSPWQRGTNENTNGLIRDFFPKGTDFNDVSEKELRHVENLLNERPRKCLQYCTPDEVFSLCQSVALKS